MSRGQVIALGLSVAFLVFVLVGAWSSRVDGEVRHGVSEVAP